MIEQLQLLVRGEVDSVCLRGARLCTSREYATAIFPGAFNPLHDGHRRMAGIAASRIGSPVAFEISLTNVDKSRLEIDDVLTRVRQFDAEQSIWLTCAETFVKKARIFSNTTFIVGADTIARVGSPRYYGDDSARRDQAIEELNRQNSSFLVFGRLADGDFRTLADLDLPLALRKLCTQIPEREFRADISSTQLREAHRSSSRS